MTRIEYIAHQGGTCYIIAEDGWMVSRTHDYVITVFYLV